MRPIHCSTLSTWTKSAVCLLGLERELLLLVLLVFGVTFPRLTTLPICGEEPRRAEVAKEMIATGDWVVPRQQGEIYCTRPPLQNWAIALMGLLRGRVDPVAIRLPSALATSAMAILCYLYGRTFLGPLGAFAAGAAFATMGQVLQIGTMGETDPLFAALLSASLLLWHWGYARRWPKLLLWTVAPALAGLAGLTKGIQAPLYFFAVLGAYLLIRRDWRTLFGWPMFLAATVLAAVVAAWTVPYLLATDWQHTREIWLGQVEQRMTHHGLTKHLLKHPLETFACMLPWSPMLLVFCHRSFRRAILPAREHVQFLLLALAVTFPSVWLVPEAANRYYLPMYPAAALLVGLAIQYTAEQRSVASLQQAWRRFLAGLALAVALGGLFVAGVWAVSRLSPGNALAPMVQPLGLTLAFAAASAATVLVLVHTWRVLHPQWALASVAVSAALVGFAYRGLVLNAQVAAANDLRPAIAELKTRLPEPESLVSFGPVFHRFRYYYGSPIRLLALPENAAQVPPEIRYFCVQGRLDPAGRTGASAHGRPMASPNNVATPELPFAWEPVYAVRCGRNRNDDPQPVVVVGRIAATSRVAENPCPESPRR